jgi:hypothetical protein
MNPNTYLSPKHTEMFTRRDIELRNSDWTQGADASNVLTAEQIAAWATYRQVLRDLPDQEGFPNVEFPSDPNAPVVSGE